MEQVKEGALCATMLPKDAHILNSLSSIIFEKSREGEGCINQRMLAPLAAIASIFVAIVQIPIYAVRTLLDFTIAVVNLNEDKEFEKTFEDAKGVFGCTAFSLVTILFVAVSIIAPTTSFAYFEPAEYKSVESDDAVALKKAKALLASKDKKLKSSAKKLKEREEEVVALRSTAEKEGTSARIAATARTGLVAELTAAKKTLDDERLAFAQTEAKLREGFEERIRAAQTSQSADVEEIVTQLREQYARSQEQLEAQLLLAERKGASVKAEAEAELLEKQAQLESATAKIASLETDCDRLRRDIKGDDALQQELEKTILERNEARKALAASKDETTKEREAKEELIVEYESKVLALTQEKDKIGLANAEYDAKISAIQAEIATQREATASLTRERDELRKALEELVARLEREEKARFDDPGTEIHSFVLNGTRYDVICSAEDENSRLQADRLNALVRRFRASGYTVQATSILDSVKTATLGDRIIIDLKGVTNPHLIPDVSAYTEEVTEAELQEISRTTMEAVSSYIRGEEYDPTKLPKYDCYMQEMNRQCKHLFAGEDWGGPDADDVTNLGVGIRDLRTYILFDASPGMFDNPRDRYQGFCKKLDEVCTLLQDEKVEHPQKAQFTKIVNAVVLVRWMKVSLDGYLNGLVSHVREASTVATVGDDLTLANFGAQLRYINDEEVRKAPEHVKKATLDLAGQKLSGEIGGENFTGKKNTPGIRSVDTYSDGTVERSVAYVRHGCPTAGGFLSGTLGWLGRLTKLGGGDSGERVVPNYHQFLTALETSDDPGAAFITTHQQYDGGNEHTRVHEVMELQVSHRNCAVLVQPIGQGHLGKKEGKYKGANSYEELKAAIRENFFADKSVDKDFSRCQLPNFIKDNEGYEAEMLHLIDFVHETFFPGDEDFSDAGKWQQFLLIFYTYQRLDLMFRFEEHCGLPIKYMTTFCKDFLDRGGIVALTHASIMAMLTDQFGDLEWMKGQVRHVVGPPLLVKRQEMIPKKLAIYGEGLHARLAEIYEDKGGRLAHLKAFRFAGKWGVTGHALALMPGQKALPDIGEIRTVAQMRDRLKWLQRAGQAKAKKIPPPQLASALGRGPEVPLDTRVYFNATEMTVQTLIEEQAGEHGVKLMNCLKLAMNGIMDEGRDEMRIAMDREEKKLKLGEAQNLRYVITVKDGEPWKIHMRWDHKYTATGDISGDPADARFRTEMVGEGCEFGIVQTSLGVELNLATGQINKAGTFKWQVLEIR